MPDRLTAMESFVRVVDSGSFSSAARLGGVTQSSISKAIAMLEHQLGARLLNRTTRSLSPTPAGAIYYERCKRVLDEVEEADREARLGQFALQGRLRINTSAMLGVGLVLPALLAFTRENPQVAPQLVMEDRRIDPVEEDADLIIRLGVLSNSSLVSRRAGAAPTVACASPGYLAASSPLDSLADLGQHAVIGFLGRFGASTRFEVTDSLGGTRDVQLHTPIVVSSGVLAHQAALGGAGIAFLPRFLVNDDLKSGRLVQVLPGAPLPPAEVSVLHPFGRRPPARVTAFMDFAVALWRRRGQLSESGRDPGSA